MAIDMSPMSSFLTAVLYIVGIPAIILSIVVWIKIARSFYVDRDYELEMPSEAQQEPPLTDYHRAKAHAERTAGGAHATSKTRESVNARMMQSG